MKKILSLSLITLVTMMPYVTMAHAGHGNESPLSPGHYVVNPQHAIPLLLTVLGCIAAAWFFNWVGNRIGNRQ